MQNFSEFGKAFQEKTCQALLFDNMFASQIMEVLDVQYFELKHLQFLMDRSFSYYKKYKVFPSLTLLVTIIKDDLKKGTDITLRDQIVEFLMRIKSNPDAGDLIYVKEKALEFCRKQALKAALEGAVEQLAASKYESIVESIKAAVMVGTAPQLGHDFFNDFEERFALSKRNCIGTGLPQLDKVLNGGIGAGELSCIISPTGCGKSHFLVSLGAVALQLGINVVHYTFELSETLTGIRYDSHLADVDSNLAIENKEMILENYEKNKQNYGQLIIKEFPANTATVYSLRAHLERLETRGFKPGLIIIDYADIMRSTRQYDSLRHELKLVYEELRSLAMEKQVHVATASQSNKEGSQSDVVDLSNMSEAYGKAFVCDIVLSLSRKTTEKASGWGRLFLVKSRAGKDGFGWTVKINTARSKFEIVGDENSFQEADDDEARAQKLALKKKWDELRKDPAFQKNQIQKPDVEG